MSQEVLRFKSASVIVIGMVLVIGVGMFWKSMMIEPDKRALKGAYMGRLAKPAEPELLEPIQQLLVPNREFRPMKITHLPRIRTGEIMPHPYVGACINCHLVKGGAIAGSQDKTVVGAILEKVSKNVVKLGPTITPQSQRPHPPAGRCIKCHDLVVQVPVESSKFRWQ